MSEPASKHDPEPDPPLDDDASPPADDTLACDDGEPLETPDHRSQMNLLIETLDYHWRDRNDVYVGGNMFVHFTEVGSAKAKFRGPDVFAVSGETSRLPPRKNWAIWRDTDRFPDVVIELTSDSTREIDFVEKARIYRFVWRLPDYFIFDLETLTTTAHRIVDGNAPYAIVPAGANGRFTTWFGLELGLWTGTFISRERTWLRWFLPNGEVLPTQAEHERANAEAERANAEAERANAEAERANAEAERASAEAERARADQERARADALAAEVAALKALLGRS